MTVTITHTFTIAVRVTLTITYKSYNYSYNYIYKYILFTITGGDSELKMCKKLSNAQLQTELVDILKNMFL